MAENYAAGKYQYTTNTIRFKRKKHRKLLLK